MRSLNELSTCGEVINVWKKYQSKHGKQADVEQRKPTDNNAGNFSVHTGRVGRPKMWKNMTEAEQINYVQSLEAQSRKQGSRRKHRIIGGIATILAVVLLFFVFIVFTMKPTTKPTATSTKSEKVESRKHKQKPMNRIEAGRAISSELFELKDAAEDYQDNGDQQALVSRLQDLQAQNEQLETRLPEGHAKEAVQTINKTASQVEQNPQNAGNIVQNNVNDLAQKSGFWGNIYYRIRSLISSYQ